SECLLFGSLIATYLVYKERSLVGPYPHEILNIPFTSFSTFDLLMSSLAMVLALAAVQRGDMKQGKLWLFVTALLGLVFLGGQFWEFSHFLHEGLGLTTNLFGSTFYVLTGTHGAHVTVGVIWLLTLWTQAVRGKLGPGQAITVEITGDRKSTRLNSSHVAISYAVFCLKKKNRKIRSSSVIADSTWIGLIWLSRGTVRLAASESSDYAESARSMRDSSALWLIGLVASIT